jgi:hypothetical protein
LPYLKAESLNPKKSNAWLMRWYPKAIPLIYPIFFDMLIASLAQNKPLSKDAEFIKTFDFWISSITSVVSFMLYNGFCPALTLLMKPTKQQPIKNGYLKVIIGLVFLNIIFKI